MFTKFMRISLVLLGLFVLLLSCSNPLNFEHYPTHPARSITDAAHDGSDEHFYFLPPLVANPSCTGTFDGSFEPVVEILNLTTQEPLATFSKYQGSNGEVVRADPLQEHYIVNWHTDLYDLDAATTYRICVLVPICGSLVELGYADVDVVDNGRDLRNVNTKDYIPLLDGRTLPIKFRIEIGAGSSSLQFSEISPHLVASDGELHDGFGNSVAVSGDGSIIVVGAYVNDIGPNVNQGQAYIFTKSGAGWIEAQQLIALDGKAHDMFGVDAAISADGSTIVIGAFYHDSAEGTVYVYTKQGERWVEFAEHLKACDAAPGDLFGLSVAISRDGSVIAVTAYADDSNTGSAYVYIKYGDTWVQAPKLLASNGEVGDHFGSSVSMSRDGTVIVVSALRDDVITGTGTNIDQGSVYVFTRTGNIWIEEPDMPLVACNGAPHDFFGECTSMSGDGSSFVVGAYLTDRDSIADRGSAYIFSKEGTVWTQKELDPFNGGEASAFFGSGISLSCDGRLVVVGAEKDDVGSNVDQGSAYVFTRVGAAWIPMQQLFSYDGAAGDEFPTSYNGLAVSADGRTIAIGAYMHDEGPTEQGAAYVFSR